MIADQNLIEDGPVDGAECKSLGSSYLISGVTALADSHAFDRCDGEGEFPAAELHHLAQLGCLSAVLPESVGGLGWGVTPHSYLSLLTLLKEIGRANLSLGRIFEGHVNALQLIQCFGTEPQLQRAAADCSDGKVFGVWNTEAPPGVSFEAALPFKWIVRGGKTFASGASRIDRPVVNGRLPDGGWQMSLVSMEKAIVAIDRRSWHPLGMEGSESFAVDLTGTELTENEMIGKAGDYYLPPLFNAGAIRAAAVQLGGAEALLLGMKHYLRKLGRTKDPMQRARLARAQVAVESGKQWLRYAADEADRNFRIDATLEESESMIFRGGMARLAIEQTCTQLIQWTAEAVGARGLLQPYRFGSLISDLTMYLRQPAPDECLLETGRIALEGGMKGK